MARSRRPRRFCQRNGFRHSHAALSRAAARGHVAARRSHGVGQRLRCGGRNRGGPLRADDATLLRRESMRPTASPGSKASTSSRGRNGPTPFRGGKIVHELFVPRETAAVVLRWRWEGDGRAAVAPSRAAFFLGPRFSCARITRIRRFRFTPESVPEGERWHFYDGVPEVTARSNGTYHHEPCWYRNFLYDEELARGLDAMEDLAAPGRYEFDLAAGPAVLIFSAEGLGRPLPASSSPVELAEKLARDERARRAAFATPRLRAADAYLVRRGSGKTIIAGYPWFGDWGRDTFIAMRGLCLATGRLAEARDILTAWAGTVSQGMLPNRFPDQGDEPEYNSVDASLWYVIVVHEFLEAAGDDPALVAEKEMLLATVEAILTGYLQGTRYGIRGDVGRPAGLRRAGHATDLDGRQGGRLGRDAAHRQAGRGAGAVAERARPGRPPQSRMARALSSRDALLFSNVSGTRRAAASTTSSMSIISRARSMTGCARTSSSPWAVCRWP